MKQGLIEGISNALSCCAFEEKAKVRNIWSLLGLTTNDLDKSWGDKMLSDVLNELGNMLTTNGKGNLNQILQIRL